MYALASRISPVPWASESNPASLVAVEARSFFTWSGLMVGVREMISAAAPETTAAACEVPLPRNSASVTRPVDP